MKTLILKLGLLMFSLAFIVGVYREIPTATLIYRSFVAFLVTETLLVAMAVVFIKLTESMRVDEEEFEESAAAEQQEATPATTEEAV